MKINAKKKNDSGEFKGVHHHEKNIYFFCYDFFSFALYAADIEADTLFSLGRYSRRDIVTEKSVKGSIEEPFHAGPFSISFKLDFFVCSPNRHIDAGLETGLDLRTYTAKVSGELFDKGVFKTKEAALFLGAVLRYNLNRHNSFSCSLGIKPLLVDIETEEGKMDPCCLETRFLELQGYLTASYKFWLMDGKFFHLGINSGVLAFVPISNEYCYPDPYGFGADLFIGFCFNFGRLSLDRF